MMAQSHKLYLFSCCLLRFDKISRVMTSSPPAAQLPWTLSNRQLTIGLISLTIIPFLFVVLLYFSVPTTPDPQMDVQVSVGQRNWIANEGVQPRQLPSLIIKNPTADSWQNVNMSINEQFYYYHHQPLQSGEELVVPLKFFHTKGNQNFPPENQPLNKLMVFAQIPSGARAIAEFESHQIPGLGTEPAHNDGSANSDSSQPQ